MNKIKIGQIGIGHNHASEKMRAIRKFSDIFEVVGVAEEDNEWMKQRGNMDVYEGLKWMSEEELLATEGLQAILVENDVWKMTSTAQCCIDANLHIHLDKPGGEDIDEFEKLLFTAKEKKRTVQMAYMYRYNPAIQNCYKAIKEGSLGEIFEIDSMMSTEHSAEYRDWLRHFKGGAMYIFGSHLIDLIVSMMGRPENIISFQKQTGFDGIEVPDNCLAVLEYKHGTSTVRINSTEVNGFGRRQFVVCGTKGTIEIKPFEKPTVMTLAMTGDGNAYEDHKSDVPLPEISGRYDEQILDFAKMIRGEKENPFTYEHELQVHKIILKASGFDIDW